MNNYTKMQDGVCIAAAKFTLMFSKSFATDEDKVDKVRAIVENYTYPDKISTADRDRLDEFNFNEKA